MPRGIGTYGSKRGRPPNKKYQMGGTIKNMTLKKFRHGGMCKRK